MDAETGLYYFGARYYDAGMSLWLGVDPLADHPNQVDKSPFAYAWNNPIVLNDPDGKCPLCPQGEDAAATYAVGAIVENEQGSWTWNGTSWVSNFSYSKASITYLAGVLNAIGSNSLLGVGRGDPNAMGEYASYAEAGQTAGDIISVVQGAVEMAISTVGTGAEAVAAPVSGGASTLAIAPTVALGVHGASTTGTAMSNLLSPSILESSRGINHNKPDPSAKGDHSIFNDRGNSTFKKNEKNPTGFDEVKRVDTKGAAHKNRDGTSVPTPHVHTKGSKEVKPAIKGQDY